MGLNPKANFWTLFKIFHSLTSICLSTNLCGWRVHTNFII